MTRRLQLALGLLMALVLATLVVTVSAQNPAQTNPQQTAPDRKAYTDANAIKEPDKKIEALEKFVSDFPESNLVSSACVGIVDTLVKSHPDQKSKILELAGTAVDKASTAQAKANACNSIATQLCDAGDLMDDAEQFACKGVALIEEESAKVAANPIAETKANPLANANARPAQNPQAGLSRLKPNLQVTLGKIYLKRKDLKSAMESFRTVIEINPFNPEVHQ